MFELGLHDGVMFVFQVEQDGSELLVLTQISKGEKISASISFHEGHIFLTNILKLVVFLFHPKSHSCRKCK